MVKNILEPIKDSPAPSKPVPTGEYVFYPDQPGSAAPKMTTPTGQYVFYPDQAGQAEAQEEEAGPRSWTDAFADTGKSVMGGIYSGVGDAIGYGIEAAGEAINSPGTAAYGKEMRKIQQAEGEKWLKSMSPEGQAMMGKELFDGFKPNLDDQFLGSVVMKAFHSLPGMIVTAPVGAGLAGGIERLGAAALPEIAGALVSGSASPVGKSIIQAAKTQGLYRALRDRALSFIPSATGYGAAEGGLAGLQNAAQTRSDIEAQNPDDLYQQSSTFRDYVEAHNGDRVAAQQELAKDAAGDVAVRTLISTGTIGVLTGGGALGMISRSGKTAGTDGILKSMVKGGVEEFAQETPQSGGESLIQNLATRDYVDPDIDVWDKVLSQALEGGVVGFASGAGLGGAGASLNKMAGHADPTQPVTGTGTNAKESAGAGAGAGTGTGAPGGSFEEDLRSETGARPGGFGAFEQDQERRRESEQPAGSTGSQAKDAAADSVSNLAEQTSPFLAAIPTLSNNNLRQAHEAAWQRLGQDPDSEVARTSVTAIEQEMDARGLMEAPTPQGPIAGIDESSGPVIPLGPVPEPVEIPNAELAADMGQLTDVRGSEGTLPDGRGSDGGSDMDGGKFMFEPVEELPTDQELTGVDDVTPPAAENPTIEGEVIPEAGGKPVLSGQEKIAQGAADFNALFEEPAGAAEPEKTIDELAVENRDVMGTGSKLDRIIELKKRLPDHSATDIIKLQLKIQGLPDRRKDEAQRTRIEDLTLEEAQKELRTSFLTGLKNKRAYDESEKKPLQRSIDIDDLKRVNDGFSHDDGDRLIQHVAAAIASSKHEESYHLSGDEFLLQGDTAEELDAITDNAYLYLEKNPLSLVRPDGTEITLKVGFSHGTAETYKEADADLQKHKDLRKNSGDRIGIREEPGTTDQGESGEQVEVSQETSEVSPAEDHPQEPWEQTPTDSTPAAPDQTIKEPWELTRADLAQQVQASKEKDGNISVSYNGRPIGTPALSAKHINVDEYFIDAHKHEVETAYRAGKQVPADVLKEYPDIVINNSELGQRGQGQYARPAEVEGDAGLRGDPLTQPTGSEAGPGHQSERQILEGALEDAVQTQARADDRGDSNAVNILQREINGLRQKLGALPAAAGGKESRPTKKTIPVPDSKLVEIEEISERIESIDSQVYRLEGVENPKDWNKQHEEIKKLNARKDALWITRAELLKAVNNETNEPINEQINPDLREEPGAATGDKAGDKVSDKTGDKTGDKVSDKIAEEPVDLKQFYKDSLAGESNEKREIKYQPVSSEIAGKIKEAVGIDVEGYSHAVDNYAIKHINKKHGDGKKERDRGQIAISEKDIELIPEIVSSPDKIESVMTKLNKQGVAYTKRVNGNIFYLEEVRTGKKTLSAVTIRKSIAGAPDASPVKEPSAETSETFSDNSDKKITKKDEKVKARQETPKVYPGDLVEFRTPGGSIREGEAVKILPSGEVDVVAFGQTHANRIKPEAIKKITKESARPRAQEKLAAGHKALQEKEKTKRDAAAKKEKNKTGVDDKAKDVEIKTEPDGDKVVSVDMGTWRAEKLKPREQKEYLLAEIDTAIDDARANSSEYSDMTREEFDKQRDGLLKSTKKQMDIAKSLKGNYETGQFKYIFEVPGDGTFTIYGDVLYDFRDMVGKQFPLSSVKTKFKPSTEGQINYATRERKFKQVAGDVSKVKPKDLGRLIFEATTRTIKKKAGDVVVPTFSKVDFFNWLLSQDLSPEVLTEVKRIHGKQVKTDTEAKKRAGKESKSTEGALAGARGTESASGAAEETEFQQAKTGNVADQAWNDQAAAVMANAGTARVVYENQEEFVKNGPAGAKTASGYYDPATNTIYINKDRAQKDTIFHEFAHPFVDRVRAKNPEFYQQGIDLISGTAYETKAKKEGYADPQNEALVQAIGEKGAAIEDLAQRNRFLAWVKKLASAARRLFKKLFKVEMTLDEFTDAVAYGMREKQVEGGRLGKQVEGGRLKAEGAELAFGFQSAKTFSDSVDDFLAGRLGNQPVVIGPTSEVLKALGAPALPVVISKDTLLKVLDTKHGIPAETLKQIPEQLKDPVMVFDSATQKNSLVVMTELSHEGKTIIAAVHLSKRSSRHVVNNIASIHPRKRDSHFTNWLKSGLLRYANKEKSREWFMTRGLQLPKVRGTHRDSDKKVIFNTDIVKPDQTDVDFQQAAEFAADTEQPAEYVRPSWLKRMINDHPGHKVWEFFSKTGPEWAGKKSKLIDDINRGLITDYRQDEEFISLRRDHEKRLAQRRQKAAELARVLAAFPRAEQARIGQIIEGSITNTPKRYAAALKAAEEFKALEAELQKLGLLGQENRFRQMNKKEIAAKFREIGAIEAEVIKKESQLQPVVRTRMFKRAKEISNAITESVVSDIMPESAGKGDIKTRVGKAFAANEVRVKDALMARGFADGESQVMIVRIKESVIKADVPEGATVQEVKEIVTRTITRTVATVMEKTKTFSPPLMARARGAIVKDIRALEAQKNKILERIQLHYKMSGKQYLRMTYDTIERDKQFMRHFRRAISGNRLKKGYDLQRQDFNDGFRKSKAVELAAAWRADHPGQVLDKNVRADLEAQATEAARREFSKWRWDHRLAAPLLVMKGISEEGHDAEMMRLFNEIAHNDEWSATEKSLSQLIQDNPGKEYDRMKQLPKTDKMGPLAGLYVRPEIYDYLNRTIDQRSDAGKIYDEILRLWKTGKVVMNPASQARNIMSGFILADMAGVGFSRVDMYVKAAKELRKKGAIFKEAQAEALFGVEWAGHEITSFLDEMADLDPKGKTVFARAAKMARTIAAAPGKNYQGIEQFFKLMVYMAGKEKGLSPTAAKDHAEKWTFNYLNIPSGIRWAKRWYSPFITFTYKAMPRFAEIALTQPWKLAKYLVMMKGVEALTRALRGESDDDLDREEQVLPAYMRRNILPFQRAFLRVPYSDDMGRSKYMDLTYILPWGDVGEQWGQSGFNLVPRSFLPSHPAYIAAAEVAFNEILFTGQELKKPSSTDGDYAKAVGIQMWRQAMPTLAPGGYGYNKFMSAFSGKADDAERDRSISEVIFDTMLGIKVKSIDYTEERGWRAYELRLEMADVKKIFRKNWRRLVSKDRSTDPERQRDREADLLADYYARIERVTDKLWELP